MRQTDEKLQELNYLKELSFEVGNGEKLTVVKKKSFIRELEQDEADWDFKTDKDKEVFENLPDDEQERLKERLGNNFRNDAYKWIIALWDKLERLDPSYDNNNFYAKLDDWFKSYFG